MSDLSLFDIDSQLHDLLTQWQEAPADQLESSQAAIREYVGEVIQSGGPGAPLHPRALRLRGNRSMRRKPRGRRNAPACGRRAGIVSKRLCSNSCRNGAGRKASRASSRARPDRYHCAATGGLQPLRITDAALIPDELRDVTITASLAAWKEIGVFPDAKLPRVPSNERIRAALQKPCPWCEGVGRVIFEETQLSEKWVDCPECNGTKTASVPGCRLEPRGESGVVK